MSWLSGYNTKKSYLLTTKDLKMKFNDLSGLGIPEILMDIISYHDFSNFTISTMVITCHGALVTCYLSKVFIIVEKE